MAVKKSTERWNQRADKKYYCWLTTEIMSQNLKDSEWIHLKIALTEKKNQQKTTAQFAYAVFA